jgi:hypothetical protein
MEGGTVSDELIDRIIDSLGTWHPRCVVEAPGTSPAGER